MIKNLRTKIRNSLKKMLGQPHLSGNALRRLEVLSTMVSGVLAQSSSRLSDIARSNPDQKQHASKEKQMVRWIQSAHTSYCVHYLPYIEALLRSLAQSGELVFSINGSTGGQGCMVLMFSVIYKKRAIPIVWHVVKARKGHLPEDTHRELLGRLVPIVPADCRITIVGDGEYDGCGWQADIVGLGWNYVLRTGIGQWIETFFSDQKSRGFNIQRSKIGKPERLAKLLIATCLAYILCILAGVMCLKSKLYPLVHRTDRCDLSLFSLGKRFIELLVDLRQWRSFNLQLLPT